MYLDDKVVVVPPRKHLVEIIDIFTWIQTLTIYVWIFCSTHHTCWQDLTTYKLLILQTAHHFPGPAWLNYVAFRKDAVASGLADLLRVNLDLYNFSHPESGCVPAFTSSDFSIFFLLAICSHKGSSESILYCHSWNEVTWRWPFGGCWYTVLLASVVVIILTSDVPFKPGRLRVPVA